MPFMPWGKDLLTYLCYNGKPVYNLSGQRVFKGYKEWRWRKAVATFFSLFLGSYRINEYFCAKETTT